MLKDMKLTNSVVVILVGQKDSNEGMAISWVTQVEDKHLILSVPKNAKTTKQLLMNKVFTVNVLAHGQENIAKVYGGSNSKEATDTKRDLVDKLKDGMPILKHCCSTVICELASTNILEEQMLIVAKIKEIITNKGCIPLVYNKNSYFE